MKRPLSDEEIALESRLEAECESRRDGDNEPYDRPGTAGHRCNTPEDQYADGPWSWTCPGCGTEWERHGRFWWEPADRGDDQ